MNAFINDRRERNKSIVCETNSFYNFPVFLLITIALLIAVNIYCYLIKYKAKQTNLLPFYITNKELKAVLYQYYIIKMESNYKLKKLILKIVRVIILMI